MKTEKTALEKQKKFKKKIKKKEKKKLLKNKKTHLNDLNAEKNDFSFLEDEDEISPELAKFLKEQEEAEIEEENENNFDDIMGDWDDDDEIEETDEDPLSEFEGGDDHEEQEDEENEAPTEKIEHVKERVSSEQNRKNISRLGAKVLDKADVFKAKLCSKISGLHLAEYVADDETKELLLECIKEYLATKEVEELTPFGALMLALSMWTLPPLGVALLDRFQLKKEDRPSFKRKTSTKLNKPSNEATEEEDEEAEGEAITDYSHLKEVQEQRKIFKTHSNGNYQRTKNGTYISVDLADEAPSPEVQELIDQGKKDREIRKILGYG